MKKQYNKITVILLIVAMLLGCGLQLNSQLNSLSFKSVCRHQAVMAALMFKEQGYPVLIKEGPRYKEKHWQAQAHINGKWEWLVFNGAYAKIDKIDSGFIPEKSLSLQTALNKMITNKY